MSTYSNSAREVEMPDGNVVVLHSEPTGGANTTSNIKKFKYDDNGHVTESSAANATDLNLNSYSTPTTGSTDIGTSDAVQTAIGKLDHQSHIDQTNILYVADQIGKNQLDTSLDALKAINTDGTWNGNVYTVSTGTITVNTDGTITIKKTGTSSRMLFYLTSNTGISGTKYAGYIFSGTPQGGSKYTYGMNGEQAASPWSSICIDFGSGAIIQSSSIPVCFYLSLNAAYTTPSDGLTFKPMICTPEAWSISHDFAPYALPNSDLTYLEAEDRAALAEEIDAGAKNKVDIGDVTITGSWFVLDHVAISLSAGSYVFSYTSNQSISGDIQLIIRNGTTALADVTVTSKSGRIEIPFTLASAANNITLYSVRAGTYSDFMICTKAAFGVSQKFVPYRYDSYTAVWQNISNSTTLYARRVGRVVTINGFMDNISFTANTAVTIGTVNSSIGIPPNQVRAVCNVGSNAYSVGKQGYVTISSTDGQIKVTSEYSGTGAVYFSLSYII